MRELLSRLRDPFADGSYGRADYFRDGVILMLVKYVTDALVIWAVTGLVWTPIDYLAAMANLQGSKTAAFPYALNLGLMVWTLLFVCIGVLLSVRRARDADVAPGLVVLFFLPLLNYALMLLLVTAPSRPRSRVESGGVEPAGKRSGLAIALGVGAGLITGLGLTALGTLYLNTYGWTLFLAMPFVIGVASAFVARRMDPDGPDAATLVVLLTLGVVAGGVVLFAIEGLVCLAMAVPLVVPLALVGGVVGRDLARRGARGSTVYMLVLLLIPGQIVDAAVGAPPPLREVMSAIEIDAPPEQVWAQVVSFPEITSPPAWYFRFGLSMPLRARIEGSGVGAVRWCEFTTGAFREPITAWDEPRRLAFDVTDQPPPLREWSPYRTVYAPHVEGFFRSTRGEFRLVPLPGNRTRLEGRTWYSLNMQPQLYWAVISDTIVHRIHDRVLLHIREHAERPAR